MHGMTHWQCVCSANFYLFQKSAWMPAFFHNYFNICIVVQVKLISGRGNRVDALARGNRPPTMGWAQHRIQIPCLYRTSNRQTNHINNKTVHAAWRAAANVDPIHRPDAVNVVSKNIALIVCIKQRNCKRCTLNAHCARFMNSFN